MRHLLAISVCCAGFTLANADEPKTQTVQPERLTIKLELSGKFESDQSFEVGLRPLSWSKLEVKSAVPHGTAVPAGSPLITLDLDDLKRAIATAKQDLELATLDVAAAKVSLDALKATTPIEIAAAKRSAKEAADDLAYFLEVTKERSISGTEESLKRSRYSLEYAEEELNQLRQMYEEDDLTEETEEIILKRAQRSVDSAAYSLESAEIRAERELEVDLPRREQRQKESTERSIAQVETRVVSLEAAMKKSEIDLQKKRVALQLAEEKLQELTKDFETLSAIVSPIDGLVYYGRVHAGTWSGKEKADGYLQPGGTIPSKQIVMTVVSPKVSHLRTTISEKDLRNVRVGMSGTGVATSAPDDKFAVTAESVSRVPVSDGRFSGVFRLSETVDSVVAGMSGDVTLIVYDSANAIVVPKSAVTDKDGDSSVWVKTSEGTSRVVVTTGQTKGDDIEITAGLSAGEVIFLSEPESK